jgi:hypothetical protein
VSAQHTPGPWQAERLLDDDGTPFVLIKETHGCPLARLQHVSNDGANANLIAAAPDHAMLASALVAGLARWEPFAGSGAPSGELCVGGFRYCTTLDEFGVPVLADHTRAALTRAVAA